MEEVATKKGPGGFLSDCFTVSVQLKYTGQAEETGGEENHTLTQCKRVLDPNIQ